MKTAELKREPAWKDLSSKDEAALEKYCKDYMDFLSKAKTERLAFKLILEMAKKAGFKDLDAIAAKGGKLKAGDKIYRARDGKTLLMAIIGKKPAEEGMNFVGGHMDCPRLDAKPMPIYQNDDLVLLDTHFYGGLKRYQWLALPLAIYGTVVRKDGSIVDLAIGDKPGDPVFVITDILPHLDNEQSRKTMADAIPGERMNVLIGSRPIDKKHDEKDYKDKAKLRIMQLLKEYYGIEEEDFLSAEIEIVPAGQARELGFDRSMILGYGHDDRVCAYASAQALFAISGIPEHTAGALICDKEEIGSYGRTGMDSTFFENTIAEIVNGTAKSYSDLAVRRTLEHSNMLSADVVALADPDYPGSNSRGNQNKLNCGIGLCKYTGARGKAGTSDASAEFVGKIRKIFNDAHVAWQMGELGNMDAGGGGTIALYMARLGLNVIDCGVGLFSMHAPWEVAGKLDIYMAFKGYLAFLKNA